MARNMNGILGIFGLITIQFAVFTTMVMKLYVEDLRKAKEWYETQIPNMLLGECPFQGPERLRAWSYDTF